MKVYLIVAVEKNEEYFISNTPLAVFVDKERAADMQDKLMSSIANVTIFSVLEYFVLL
jgi:hypothetical protein